MDSGGSGGSPAPKAHMLSANSIPVDGSVVKDRGLVKQISFDNGKNSTKPQSPSKVVLLNGDDTFPGVRRR